MDIRASSCPSSGISFDIFRLHMNICGNVSESLFAEHITELRRQNFSGSGPLDPHVVVPEDLPLLYRRDGDDGGIGKVDDGLLFLKSCLRAAARLPYGAGAVDQIAELRGLDRNAGVRSRP